MNFWFDWIYWELDILGIDLQIEKKSCRPEKNGVNAIFTCRINEGLPDPITWSALLLCILVRGFEECMLLA